MENNVNKQSGKGTVYTEKDLDNYIERLKEQKIGNDLTILKEAVRRRPETILNIFSSYDITDDRGIIYTTPLAKVDSRFINTVLDTLQSGEQISQFLNCFYNNKQSGWGIGPLSSQDWSPFAKKFVTIKNKNVEDVLEAHPEVLWFTSIFDKKHGGIIDESFKNGTNKEYMHKAISRLVNKGVDECLAQNPNWLSWSKFFTLEDMYLSPNFPREVLCKDQEFIKELVLGEGEKNSEIKQESIIKVLDFMVRRHHTYNFDDEKAQENLTNFYLNIVDLQEGRKFLLEKINSENEIVAFDGFPKVVARLAIKEYEDLKDAEKEVEFVNSPVMQNLQNITSELLKQVVDEIGNIENANVKELSAAVKVLDIMEKMVHEKEYDIAEQKI